MNPERTSAEIHQESKEEIKALKDALDSLLFKLEHIKNTAFLRLTKCVGEIEGIGASFAVFTINVNNGYAIAVFDMGNVGLAEIDFDAEEKRMSDYAINSLELKDGRYTVLVMYNTYSNDIDKASVIGMH